MSNKYPQRHLLPTNMIMGGFVLTLEEEKRTPNPFFFFQGKRLPVGVA